MKDINFEVVSCSNIENFLKLNNCMVDLMKGKEKYYYYFMKFKIFYEIQDIESQKKTVNSIKATKNGSLFIKWTRILWLSVES